jgi:hypothetical protein
MARLFFASSRVLPRIALAAASVATIAACSANVSTGGIGASGGNAGGGGTGAGSPTGGTGGILFGGMGGQGGDGGMVIEGDPKTCEDAAAIKSYVGCDFWPTVTANNVWSVFDFAVVVANAGDQPADVTVLQGSNTIAGETIPANGAKTIYLPWVPALKGPDADACGSASPLSSTVRANDGAYRLTSSVPVTVYQFNALQYAPQGGPPGKNWGACPAQNCFLECFSYSNDASLLLPSTAMTNNYRVTGLNGWQLPNIGPTLTVTGTQDGTTVTVTLSSTGQVVAGGGVQGASAGGSTTFTLDAGDAVELVGTASSDFSGSLVQSNKPVQVISGMPCTNVPQDVSACDHVEESVFPAETLGKRYFVTVPTGPLGQASAHVVRLYGNVDGTQLTYPAGQPQGAPSSIDAGQVVTIGPLQQSFEVLSPNHEFAVASFQTGADYLGLSVQGDPAQSLATTVEQYRKKYVFLAPADYDVNFVDIIMPLAANVTVDGAPINTAPQPIGSNYGVARVQLSNGNNGVHVLESNEPVGIQVMGYGEYTSYQYPGGLDLKSIAPPPPPPN